MLELLVPKERGVKYDRRRGKSKVTGELETRKGSKASNTDPGGAKTTDSGGRGMDLVIIVPGTSREEKRRGIAARRREC